MPPPWRDLIEEFMLFTDDDPSPVQFRLWSGIGMIAGALERRVWAKAYARYLTFPNLYTLLTAAPGVGKQCIYTVRGLWKETCEPGTKTPAFRVAPKQMTKASLVDRLAKSQNVKLVKSGTIRYNTLLIGAEEFQVLLPAYDTEYISTLNEIFNNPENHDEERRTGSVRELNIEHPQLNILAGVQPSYFVSTFPEEAWTTGFARRIIMVYAAEGPDTELFAQTDLNDDLHKSILTQLSHLSGMYGQMSWDADAAAYIAALHKSKIPPAPEHSKLTHYNNSRSMFLIKLSIIAAVARSGGMLITQPDVARARGWLLDAERRMPDVFREMVGKSDTAVIDELHYAVMKAWSQPGNKDGKGGRKPIRTQFLYTFLRQRVPSEKIEKILLAADRSGVVVRVPGTEDLWVPKPRNEHGVE